MDPRDALARKAVLAFLSRLRGGCLEVAEGGRTHVCGDPAAGLRATVHIENPRAWRQMLRGSLGAGEAFVDGDWRADDLVAALRIVARNLHGLDRLRRLAYPVTGPMQRALARVPANTLRGARENISAHYDLGNDLFAAFLDERMIYSCAFFEDPDASLEQAQLAKLERICRALALTPDDHLVEIGTGWGGLAIHAAAEYGCRVTTTTISRRQAEYARAKVEEAGLADRVEVVERDYRELTGRYDKLVSIEMIEAVGWQYFREFFRRCSELLHDDGLMFLQAIVIADELYEHEKAARSFANTHIFPGGCLPSRRLIRELTAEQHLRVLSWEDITAHYPPTLAAWRERFNEAAPRLRERGYDERFARLWNFYLASSEAGFREHRIGDVQALFAKPGYAGTTSAEARAGTAVRAA
ncbi:MAG TPA: cyclopropane-fatty-acyl-phospholipid synthase family protein [Solirubrobacterales bacterium]